MHVIINIDFAQHVLKYTAQISHNMQGNMYVEFAQNAMQMNI